MLVRHGEGADEKHRAWLERQFVKAFPDFAAEEGRRLNSDTYGGKMKRQRILTSHLLISLDTCELPGSLEEKRFSLEEDFFGSFWVL